MARSKKVFVRWRQAGFNELATSPEMQADLMARANRVMTAAGPGHDARNTTTRRARATVMTKTAAAAQAEAESHTLTSAIGAARG